MDFDAFAEHVDGLGFATVGSALRLDRTGETVDVTFHPAGEGQEIEGSMLDYTLPRISVPSATKDRIQKNDQVFVAGANYKVCEWRPDGAGLYWANLLKA